MRRISKLRPSPAMLVALIALFVAMGGTGYAAVKISGKNIKNKSIAGKKLKNRTITSGKVKKNGLGGSVIKESKLGQVPSAVKADSATSATKATTADSATKATTADNATNATNATNAITATNATRLGGIAAGSFLRGFRTVSQTSISNSANKVATATCNRPGEVALGGGGGTSAPTGLVSYDALELGPTTFRSSAIEVNGGTTANWTTTATVTCATIG